MLPHQSTHRFHLLANILLSLSLTAWGAAPANGLSSQGSDPPPPPTEAPLSSEDGLPVEGDPPWLPVQPAASLPAGGPQEDGSLGGDQPPAADALAPEVAQPDRLPAALRAFDRARNAGPEAVLAFEAAADPEVRAVIQGEVTEARRLLTKPLDSFGPELGAAALIAGINGPCAYSTLQAAITAATSGDSLRVVGQTITESINILGGKVLTITGGYDATCTTPLTGTRTTLQGAGGSVVDVNASQVSLSSLIISGGTGFGAGVDLYGLAAQATLSNTLVKFNAGTQGGGVYVSYSTAVTLTNGSLVYSNTASLNGGAAYVYGRLTALGSTSGFSTNAASLDGGNLYVDAGTVYLDNADVVAGMAVQRGGGIFATAGAVITLTNSVFVGESSPCCQSATDGGGIYADDSQVYLLGAETTVMRNTATNHGGGVYLTNGSYLYSDGSNIGNTAVAHNENAAVLGGGLYVVNSTVEFSGRIINNTASDSGGGLYASSSLITFTNVTVGGTGVDDPNTLGATGLNGAGLYLVNNTRATLNATVIVSNTLTNPGTGYGGGVYIRAGSVLTATNSRIERHLAPSDTDGRGAGLYIYDATVTLINTQILSNVAANIGGGARLFGVSTLNVLAGSTFINNQALNGEGGALAATNMPDIHVTDATFQSNTAATSGGAIYLDAGTLTFTDGWEGRFNAAGEQGSAVAVVGTAVADFTVAGGPSDSTLAGNTAGGNGGAIFASESVLVVNNLYLHHNTAARGGAIYQEGAGATAWITNALVYSNTSLLGLGAGLRNAGGAITLTQVTLAHNSGGAGLSASGDLNYLYNTIIWGNSVSSVNALSAAVCSIDQAGTAGPVTNPLFAAPGAGENYRLRPGSPAVDACDTGAPTDLDHRARPVGDGFDVGAYELVIQSVFLPLTVR